jgi:TRAP-type mannitol/chloroaromatic compound transport system permease small subunit
MRYWTYAARRMSSQDDPTCPCFAPAAPGRHVRDEGDLSQGGGDDRMKLVRGVDWLIDSIAELMGRIGWLLLLYCMILGVTDVFLRYALNMPSQWIGTTMQAAMVLIACVGGAYALKYDAFVKLDVFYASASKRRKAVLDVLTAGFSVLFLTVLIWKGIDAAKLSFRLNQMTPTAVPIPIAPIKTAIPLGAAVVLVMVIRQFIRDVHTIISGADDEPPSSGDDAQPTSRP